MKLIINGNEQHFEASLSLHEVLAQLGLKDQPIVLEWNERALFPREYAEVELQDGDRLEIVQITAGG